MSATDLAGGPPLAAVRDPARPLVGRRTLAVLLLGLGALGAAATLYLWWSDTGHGALRSLGDLFTAAGRVTGLLGGYLLLAEVALMARIPWLEHRIGADWLARTHRALGEYLVALLSAHAVLIIAGYALSERVDPLTETYRVVLTYPDVLMATVALALLVGVGVVSARRVRSRFTYETWHFLHLYAYLAVALAFAHQLVVGADFTTHAAARTVWTGAHVAVAASVLWFRVVRPVRLSSRHRLRIVAITPEAPGVVSIHVGGQDLDRLGAEAGQFFRWRFLTREGWWQAHPFSLSAAPDGTRLRLTVKALGDHSKALHGLRPGTRVLAEGPYGALTAQRRTRRRVLLLAGGIGITPLRALYESLPGRPGDVALIYRATSADEVIFADELTALAAARSSPLHYLLGPRGRRHDPLDAAALRTRVPDVARRDAYVCGPPGMIHTARRALRAAGVPWWRIHTERFDL